MTVRVKSSSRLTCTIPDIGGTLSRRLTAFSPNLTSNRHTPPPFSTGRCTSGSCTRFAPSAIAAAVDKSSMCQQLPQAKLCWGLLVLSPMSSQVAAG